MNVPLDYSQRIAALHKARTSATATYEHLIEQLHTPVAQQAPARPASAIWKSVTREAESILELGLAPDMSQALRLVAQEQPELYERYRQEQLFRGGPNPVAKSIPPAPAPHGQHPAMAALETRLAKVLERAPSLSRAEAWSRVMQRPDAQELYKSYLRRQG